MAKSKKIRLRRDEDGSQPGYDGEPPEFGVRRDYSFAKEKRVAVESTCNLNTSRISWLYAHQRIEERQYLAAERLARDWEVSQIFPTASTVMVGNGSGGGDALPGDVQVAAMQRHGAARKALGRNWAIIELVVEQNLSVEKASAVLHVHRQIGMGLLIAALHVLADHYRIG